MLDRYGPMQEGTVSYKLKPKRQQPLAPNHAVRYALLQHEVDEGTLDATSVLTALSDIDLVDFFTRFPNCKSLVLQSWESITNNVMRAVAMTLGEHLIELDLSYSKISGDLFEILLSRIRQLKILRINFLPSNFKSTIYPYFINLYLHVFGYHILFFLKELKKHLQNL